MNYLEHEPKLVASLRPSVLGFMRHYLLCLVPVVALLIYEYLHEPLLKYIPFIPETLLSLATILLILSAIAWVFRSVEVEGAVGISLILPLLLLPFRQLTSPLDVVKAYTDYLPKAILISSALMILRTEIFRRTISYRITDTGVEISGGVWRRQEQTIPYNQIGRVVLEQSVFGRLLNYGTVILVSSAEWGSEYYMRVVGAGKNVGVGYGRILKEVSRDPLKCLYGVKNPKKLKEFIEKAISAVFRAEVDQVEYLKKIYEEIKRD